MHVFLYSFFTAEIRKLSEYVAVTWFNLEKWTWSIENNWFIFQIINTYFAYAFSMRATQKLFSFLFLA